MPGPFSPADPAHYLGIGAQSVKGTGVAPTLFVPYQGDLEFSPGASFAAVREGGAGFAIQRHVKDVYLPGGAFATAIRPHTAAELYAYLLGVDNIAGGGDPYTHTITPDAEMDWLSVERNVGDEQIERTVDSALTELVLNVQKRDQGSEPRIEATFLGVGLSRQAAPTVIALEADAPFGRSLAEWTINSSADKENVESARITCRWRFDEAMLADEVTRADLMKLDLDIAVEVVMLYNDQDATDWYRAIHYGTSVGTTPSETVFSGNFILDLDPGLPTARSFQMTIPNVDWTEASLTPPNPEGNEGTRLTIGGSASGAAASLITIVSENSDAVAYV